MSQWTHFLGAIRFDSMNSNVWPAPPEQGKILMREVSEVHGAFQRGTLPSGSEGPIEFETVLTNRGPTVLITGDLRDFGERDLPNVVEWVNSRVDAIKELELMIFLRDAVILCDVEYNEKTILIAPNDDREFQLTEYVLTEHSAK